MTCPPATGDNEAKCQWWHQHRPWNPADIPGELAPPGRSRPPTKARRDYATHRHFRDTEGGPVSGLSDSNNGEVHRRGASRLRWGGGLL